MSELIVPDWQQELEQENKRLRKALEDIRQHQQIVAPTSYNISTIWVIANRALGR